VVGNVRHASPVSSDRYQLDTMRHRLTLYGETAPFWSDVEAALDAARGRVWLSTFIYESDALGRDFGERLVRAAARGVDVRLLYDSCGSSAADPEFFAELAQRGVGVKCYRPWRISRFWRYFPRDHGRLLLIDELAFTGGVNWRNDWWPAARGGGDWHDVSVAVLGPCVADFRVAYEQRWREADTLGAVVDHVTPELEPDVELIADSPASLPVIFERLCERIGRARDRIWIENSYCVPPRPLLRALRAAVMRGVDVKLLQPAHTDLPIVQTITRGDYRAWIEAGLRVYEYEPRVMHAKFAVIDDDWGTVGSFNAISPGLWWANETNLVVRDVGFARALERVFEIDLSQSTAIDTAWLARQRVWRRLWRAFAIFVYRCLERVDVLFGPKR
jgi:cardiolipin synthase